ncbi:MAG: heparinase II/III family protein [Spirochaetes bacterium]|nr:heparinase II/III family protein [Spirochaetota bacterium]
MLERFLPVTGASLPPLGPLRYVPDGLNRGAWEGLPSDWKSALLRKGIRWLGRAWPTLPARRYLDFYRDGNRSRFEQLYFMRRSALGDLVLAECVEGEGRFTADLADLIWAVCEETSWVVPAHNNHDRTGGRRDLPPFTGEPYVDLFSAETSATLAWAFSLLPQALDRESPGFRERIRHEIRHRALAPFLAHEDWGWMGLSHGDKVNNWNPWILSNLLVPALRVEDDPAQRLALVGKILRCLERFCAGYDPDGGCDEGPGYWNAAAASLFDALDLLDAESGGTLKVWGDPLLRAMGRFPMLMHLGADQFVNFADGQRQGRPDGALLARYGRCVGDADLERFGRWALADQGGLPVAWNWGHFQRSLGNLFRLEPGPVPPGPPLLRDGLLPDLQVLVARESAGTTRGFALAAKGGHNGESHNHNDVGSFIAYLDGKPLFVDAGVGEYTKQTFSSERYSIWTMQSAWHNLPQIGGVDQAAGGTYKSATARLYQGDEESGIELDLTPAWPKEAGLEAWRRRLALERRGSSRVLLEDEWVLHQPRDVRLHLLSLAEPELGQAGEVRYRLDTDSLAVLAYDGELLEATVEEKPLLDGNLRGAWGPRLWRLCLRLRREAASGSWKIVLRRGP